MGRAELRAATELISSASKDREGSRRIFAAKCAGYLQHRIGVVLIDVVTAQNANLHAELFDVLEVKKQVPAWASPTGLYAMAYRAVTFRKKPYLEAWPEIRKLSKALPLVPLWLGQTLCVPLWLEGS